MSRIFVSLFLAVCLYGCDSSRVYEDFGELPNGWAVNDTVSFEIELEPSELPYMFTSQFRTEISYPYSNLYYYFQITDEGDSLIYNALQEVQLFEVKTGKPIGSGLGDLYHIENVSLEGFQPVEPANIKVSVIQYMRLDTLRGIDRIGMRVNTQSSD